MPTSSITPLVKSWIDGWVVSRGAAEPDEEPWGWTVAVGNFKETARHLIPDGDEAVIRKLAVDSAVAGRWLKVFLPQVTLDLAQPDAAEELIMPWLGGAESGWSVDLPGFLMTLDLERSAAVAVPEGYRMRVWHRGGVVRVMVTTADGSLAARGQIAATGATAVADQIETSPLHRRKGLGSLVMRVLQNAALDAGASTGILVGTLEGRLMYEAVGWRTHAAMASVQFG